MDTIGLQLLHVCMIQMQAK